MITRQSKYEQLSTVETGEEWDVAGETATRQWPWTEHDHWR